MIQIPVPPVPSRGLVAVPIPSPDADLLKAARKLEATFLSEMLKSMNFGEVSGPFGSGPGSDQFSSFMRDAQAENMANAGGVGIAESLFNAMKARAND
ncbi:rod-binding protein [Loktanella sp. SALINAS62]|uniref:rod-binding protein n=1 Tax=Loktanella sp. SALINAS62 TaxID=2706124 RepID=UPI001B8CEAB3|nr:rod-binding protein [Loktanella sp. SALINAS62]MBS1301871.1 chemotaxis protein chel [Loktanella sp. SALINAS62]